MSSSVIVNITITNYSKFN